MLTKTQRYQKLIEQSTKRIMLFPQLVNQGKMPTITLQSNLILPSLYSFRSSQQINKNKSITHQIAQETSKQHTQNIKCEWPQSCIGLVLCQYHQNNQIFYVYGTGTLIKNNIVLTSAQNVYCRRLQKQYVNIKFISGVNGNKCNGIYDIKQVYYPKEYTMQQGYENYDFSVLQLYDDLSDNYGYLGWKAAYHLVNEQFIVYRYSNDKKEGSFHLQQIAKHKNLEQYSEEFQGSGGVFLQANQNMYYIIGLSILSKTKQYNVLSEKSRNLINQWTHQTTIYLEYNKLRAQGCKYLSESKQTHLNTIYLFNNNIDAQGCKYLSQADWKYLTEISLYNNKIDAQGCKYLSKANWIHLSNINLGKNNITLQGCRYLRQANWIHLTTIYLDQNNINSQGCKYLTQNNWPHLTIISLQSNNIGENGCKYLSQTNWKKLSYINLYDNNIGSQGCKYLRQNYWIQLSKVYFSNLFMTIRVKEQYQYD